MKRERINRGLLSCFFLLVFFAICLADESVTHLSDDELVVEKWLDSFRRVKKAIGNAIKLAMPYFMSSMSDEDLHISPECQRGLFQFIADLKATKPWALKMIDASAKVIDGLLTGTFAAYGSFDQCIDIVNPKATIRGQYCMVETWPSLPPRPRFYSVNKRLEAFKRFENDTGMIGEFTKYVQLFYVFPLRLGICAPSTCSAEDLSNIAQLVVKPFFHLNVTIPRCEVKEDVKIEGFQIPILCVSAILIILSIFGTYYDLYVYKKQNSIEESKDKGVMSDCLMAFSIHENWNKLMDLNSGADNLSVLHGIRFFTMCWIILGHTYFYINFNILKHLQITIELTSEMIFNIVTNSSLSVENFFFISGLLLMYVTMDMVKTIGKLPRVVYFILHRFWRFLPIQMFFVGAATLLNLYGSGPVWHEYMDPLVEGCKKDWWANMIFINNVYRSTKQGCLSYSWYLATDFQIYIFCILIIYIIIRKPRIGLWLNFAVIILSIIAIAVHTYIREFPPTVLFIHLDPEQRRDLMMETYYTPYRHLSPYCIGIFVGYYFQVNSAPLKLNKYLLWAGWISTFVVQTVVLFGVYPWNKGLSGTGPVATILYASLTRTAWALCIAWITLACTKGHGGFLTQILRCKVFIPLSRLTFLVYMVHPMVQIIYYAVLRDGIQAKNHHAVFTCVTVIVISYSIALALTLLLESPFINLGKIIFRRRESQKKRARAQSSSIEHYPHRNKSSKSGWNSQFTPQLSNGKCNVAFDTRENDLASVDGKTFRTVSNRREDFICHL